MKNHTSKAGREVAWLREIPRKCSGLLAAAAVCVSLVPEAHANEALLADVVLEDLKQYSAKRTSSIDVLLAPMATLNANYIRALNAQKAREQAAGSLRGIQIMDGEIQQIERSKPHGLLADVPDHEELARLRGIYATEREKLQQSLLPGIIEIEKEYATNLEGAVAVLTRAGSIAEAKKTQKQLDGVRAVILEREHEQRLASSLDAADDDGMIFVHGDPSKRISNFLLGIHEVTWQEWRRVRTWAMTNGYDLRNVGEGHATSHPVTHITWYDAIKWCNARSEMAGLQPVYLLEGKVFREGGVKAPAVNSRANGFRLPTGDEWFHAASGGRQAQGFPYSGSLQLDEVGWYSENSRDRTQPVGRKKPNELGFYDMSGNVAEWCWDDSYSAGYGVIRGGSYNFTESSARIDRRSGYTATSRYGHIGMRVARNARN